MKIENGVLVEVSAADMVDGRITLPYEVVAIANRTYFSFAGLKKVVGEKVETVGNWCFRDCSGDISLPVLATVGNCCFRDCSGDISLPVLATVGNWCFRDCSGDISLPALATAGDDCFCGSPKIKKVVGKKIMHADGISSAILAEKTVGGTKIYRCRSPRFFDGKPMGELHFVAKKGKNYAHGETLREAREDLAFKLAKNRGAEPYRGLTMDTVKTTAEWAQIYRVITGACSEGCRQFLSAAKRRRSYTLAEAIATTEKAYKGDIFKKFFEGEK